MSVYKTKREHFWQMKSHFNYVFCVSLTMMIFILVEEKPKFNLEIEEHSFGCDDINNIVLDAKQDSKVVKGDVTPCIWIMQHCQQT